MVLKVDQQRVKTLLAETITLLCKNGLRYAKELRVEAIIGITIDRDEVFLVSLNETLHPGAGLVSGSTTESQAQIVKSLVQTISDSEQDDSRVADDKAVSDAETGDASAVAEQSATPTRSHLGQIARLRTSRESSNQLVDVDTDNGSDPIICTFMLKGGKSSSKKRRRSTPTLDVSLPPSCDGNLIKNLLPVKHEDFEEDDGNSCEEFTSVTEIADNDGSSKFAISADDFQIPVDSADVGESTGTLIMTVDGSSAVTTSTRRKTTGRSLPVRHGFKQHSATTAELTDNSNRSPCRSSKSVECPDCGKVMNTPGSLRVHLTTVHKRSYQLTCALCDKGFRSEYFLRGHMASRHNMRKDFLCQICSKEFSYKHTLKEHMLNLHPTEAADMFPF